ncbi:uncharacterized protein LY89DRAFT_684372 [Mollisia scopiformis]|uniref:Uncharacterized protein n=1 Tax=Mollisia scopiformis TaxID=149040 RepID=A0A194XAV9_MOLSC|nr:uncharacterized protein LY89DRAFT_684372 [Mollisia scopiformis]KUJ17284.1 hypothetical protein LY89DRAFT_684372 [Mollisia scopiformis]
MSLSRSVDRYAAQQTLSVSSLSSSPTSHTDHARTYPLKQTNKPHYNAFSEPPLSTSVPLPISKGLNEKERRPVTRKPVPQSSAGPETDDNTSVGSRYDTNEVYNEISIARSEAERYQNTLKNNPMKLNKTANPSSIIPTSRSRTLHDDSTPQPSKETKRKTSFDSFSFHTGDEAFFSIRRRGRTPEPKKDTESEHSFESFHAGDEDAFQAHLTRSAILARMGRREEKRWGCCFM